MTLRDPGVKAASAGLPLRRRDFLALGSLAALAPLARSTAFAQDTADAAPRRQEAAAVLPLSIGYLEGSELLTNLRKLAPDLRVLTVVRRGQTFTAERRAAAGGPDP